MKIPLYYSRTPSPIGLLTLVASERGLVALHMESYPVPLAGLLPDDSRFAEVRRQLDAYFAGKLRTFDLPLDFNGMGGTPFQQQVWRALLDIPYGETLSYGEQARRIGNPKGVRAVGLANGRNPISIIIPCHRVIGKNGSLTGYGGGLERKRHLLALEQMVAPLMAQPGGLRSGINRPVRTPRNPVSERCSDDVHARSTNG